MGGGYYGGGMGVVLTRLHTRYDQQTLTDDLVFKAAEAVVGGREFMQDNDELEKGARPDSYNNFQKRFEKPAKWCPVSDERTPGLMPTNSTRTPGAMRSRRSGRSVMR